MSACSRCGHVGFTPHTSEPEIKCTIGHATDDVCGYFIEPETLRERQAIDDKIEAEKAEGRDAMEVAEEIRSEQVLADDIKAQAEENVELKEALESKKMSKEGIAAVAGALHKAEENTGVRAFPMVDEIPTEGPSSLNVDSLCLMCNACCCRAFMMVMPIRSKHSFGGDSFEVDWDTLIKEEKEKPGDALYSAEFARDNFVPIVQPNGLIDWVYGYIKGSRIVADVWFMCRKLKNNRCSAYDERPFCCRQHMCRPVSDFQMVPRVALLKGKDDTMWPGLLQTHPLDMAFRVAFGTEEHKRLAEMTRTYKEGVRHGMKISNGAYEGELVCDVADPVPHAEEDTHDVGDT